MASKYGSKTLPELRTELNKRNAKLSGRKKELIERLESYDRNQNFNQDTPEPEFSMDVPDPTRYKDIHSGTHMAHMNLELISTYLEQFEKKLDDGPIKLYQERYLLYVRATAENGVQFVKSVCRAEMRKSVTYNLDIAFRNGTVHEAQCECAAGMGPQAHCKHVCTLLYALAEFSEKGSMRVEETCTEKLQTFHKVKKFKGSPVKANDLKMPGADQLTGINFDPRPEEFRNLASYPSYFRNVCLNFPGISTMPIYQIFEPANAFGAAHDHDYLEFTPESRFLSSAHITTITDEEVAAIECRTRGQSKNSDWSFERQKRITSSNFGRIVKATSRTNYTKLAQDLLETKVINTEAINHGRTFEKTAIERYIKDNRVPVQECGLFVCKNFPFIAASPDGIVDDDVLCEVKCPFKARNQEITSKNVPYLLHEDGHWSLDKKHNYYYQIQGQLLCANRKFCDFIVFSISDVKYVRIGRDENFINEMTLSLKQFFNNYFKHALLNKCFYKPYNC